MIPTGDFTVVTLEEYEEDGEDEENGEDEKVEEEEGAEIVKEVKRNDSLWRFACGDALLYRVASAVDIIDQLSTTFKICLCTMYKRNFLDYPSQLY